LKEAKVQVPPPPTGPLQVEVGDAVKPAERQQVKKVFQEPEASKEAEEPEVSQEIDEWLQTTNVFRKGPPTIRGMKIIYRYAPSGSFADLVKLSKTKAKFAEMVKALAAAGGNGQKFRDAFDAKVEAIKCGTYTVQGQCCREKCAWVKTVAFPLNDKPRDRPQCISVAEADTQKLTTMCKASFRPSGTPPTRNIQNKINKNKDTAMEKLKKLKNGKIEAADMMESPLPGDSSTHIKDRLKTMAADSRGKANAKNAEASAVPDPRQPRAAKPIVNGATRSSQPRPKTPDRNRRRAQAILEGVDLAPQYDFPSLVPEVPDFGSAKTVNERLASLSAGTVRRSSGNK